MPVDKTWALLGLSSSEKNLRGEKNVQRGSGCVSGEHPLSPSLVTWSHSCRSRERSLRTECQMLDVFYLKVCIKLWIFRLQGLQDKWGSVCMSVCLFVFVPWHMTWMDSRKDPSGQRRVGKQYYAPHLISFAWTDHPSMQEYWLSVSFLLPSLPKFGIKYIVPSGGIVDVSLRWNTLFLLTNHLLSVQKWSFHRSLS